MFSSTGQHQPEPHAQQRTSPTFAGGSGDPQQTGYSNHGVSNATAFGGSLNCSSPPRYIHGASRQHAASPTGGGAAGHTGDPTCLPIQNDYPMPSPSNSGWVTAMGEPTVQCPRTGNLVPHNALSQQELREFSLTRPHDFAAQQHVAPPSSPHMNPGSPAKSPQCTAYNSQVMSAVLASMTFPGGQRGVVEAAGSFSIGSPEVSQGSSLEASPGNVFSYGSADGEPFMAANASLQMSGGEELFGSVPPGFTHRMNGDLTLGVTLNTYTGEQGVAVQNIALSAGQAFQTQGSPLNSPHISPLEVLRHFPLQQQQQQQQQHQQQQVSGTTSEGFCRRSRSGIGKSPTRKSSDRQSPAPYSPQRRPRTHSESSATVSDELNDMSLGTGAPSPTGSSLSPGCEPAISSLHGVVSGLHDNKMAATDAQTYAMSTSTSGNYLLLEQLVNSADPLAPFSAMDSYREEEAELAELLTATSAFASGSTSAQAQSFVSELMSLETVMDSISTATGGGSGMYEPFPLLGDSVMEHTLPEPPAGAGMTEESAALPRIESDDAMKMCVGELDVFSGRRSVEGESPSSTDGLAFGMAENGLGRTLSRRCTPTPGEHMAEGWGSSEGGAGAGSHPADMSGLPFPHSQESVVLHPSLENPYNPKLPTPPIVLTPFTSYETYMRSDDNFDEFIFPDVLNYSSADLPQPSAAGAAAEEFAAPPAVDSNAAVRQSELAAAVRLSGGAEFLPQAGGAWRATFSNDLPFSSSDAQQLHDTSGSVYGLSQQVGGNSQQQHWLSDSDPGILPRYHRSHSFQDNSLRPQAHGLVSLHHCHSDSSLVDHGGGSFDNLHLGLATGGSGGAGGRDAGIVLAGGQPFDAWSTPEAFSVDRRNRHRSRSASPCTNTRAEILFKLRKVVERRLSGADFRITGGTHRK